MRQTEVEAICKLGEVDKAHLTPILNRLSNLPPEELRLLGDVWHGLDGERRRLITRRLLSLARRNLKLNFDDIFKMALHDPDPAVRTYAVSGLAECEDPQIINMLIYMLKDDSPLELKLAIIGTLGNMAALIEGGKVGRGYVQGLARALLGLAQNETLPLEIRCQALEAIAPLNLDAVHSLIVDFYHSGTPALQGSAIRAMGKSGAPRWTPLLLRELSSKDARRRADAALACGEGGQTSLTPELINLLQDSNLRVRLASIQALGRIGGVEAGKELFRLTRSPNPTIRKATGQALNELQASTEIIPQLGIEDGDSSGYQN